MSNNSLPPSQYCACISHVSNGHITTSSKKHRMYYSNWLQHICRMYIYANLYLCYFFSLHHLNNAHPLLNRICKHKQVWHPYFFFCLALQLCVLPLTPKLKNWAAPAATGALQHLAYPMAQAAAAAAVRAHSEQRDTTSIRAARSCGLLFHTGLMLQSLCQNSCDIISGDTNSLIIQDL